MTARIRIGSHARRLWLTFRHPGAALRRHFPIPGIDDVEARTQLVIALRKSVMALALWMFLVTAIVAYELHVEAHQAGVARVKALVASEQSRQACNRTRRIAPEVGEYYALHHVLDAKTLAIYWATIPKVCP